MDIYTGIWIQLFAIMPFIYDPFKWVIISIIIIAIFLFIAGFIFLDTSPRGLYELVVFFNVPDLLVEYSVSYS